MEGYNRNADSPTSEGGLDYVGESDNEAVQGRNGPGQQGEGNSVEDDSNVSGILLE